MNAKAALGSWNEGPAKQAIVDFVTRVTTEGSLEYVASEARLAVFDNDGTLWCEKPMPIELFFILQELAEQAAADAALRDKQPWKAAYEKDYGWLSAVMTKHYQGDDSDVHVLMGGMLKAFDGMKVEEYQAKADTFLRNSHNPHLKRANPSTAYMPMVELLEYLAASGNSNGDIPMLEFVAHSSRPSLSLLVNHDDNERDIAYTAGAEKLLETAAKKGWTIVNVKSDWNRVFAD